MQKHKKRTDFIHRMLHWLELIIAFMTLIMLVGMLGYEVYRMCTETGYFDDGVNTYLHHVLTIVVGLEFVRMLLDMTPANTLEVLIVAISRHVILSHDDPLSNVACVACIAGLFAIRRFLIPKAQMTIELSEVEDTEDEIEESPVDQHAEIK